jgi:hypothetical protein
MEHNFEAYNHEVSNRQPLNLTTFQSQIKAQPKKFYNLLTEPLLLDHGWQLQQIIIQDSITQRNSIFKFQSPEQSIICYKLQKGVLYDGNQKKVGIVSVSSEGLTWSLLKVPGRGKFSNFFDKFGRKILAPVVKQNFFAVFLKLKYYRGNFFDLVYWYRVFGQDR